MQFEQLPVNSPSATSIMEVTAQKERRRDEAQRKLEWACLFCMLFMIIEFFGGYVAGSLAIMSDAAHLLSDVLSFLLSLFALYLSKYPASSTMPFGYKRAEVIGALASIFIIWMLTLGLVWAAIQRIFQLMEKHEIGSSSIPQVNGKVMFIVASLGLVVNIALMKILGHGHSHGGHGHSHGGHGHAHGSHGHAHGSHGHAHGGHGHSHGSSNTSEHSDEAEESMCHGDHVHNDHKIDESDDHHDHNHNHSPCTDNERVDCGEESIDDETSSSHTLDIDEPESESKIDSCSSENLNVRAAYLHALGDFLQSLGVCIAGALIWYEPSWQLCDPIVTLLFSIIVCATTIGIFKTTIYMLMEGTPLEFDIITIKKSIQSIPQVKEIHDLRIWSISSSSHVIAVHVVICHPTIIKESLLMQIQTTIQNQYNFDYMTIQIEDQDEARKCIDQVKRNVIV